MLAPEVAQMLAAQARAAADDPRPAPRDAAEMRERFVAPPTPVHLLDPVAEVRDCRLPGPGGPLRCRLYRPLGVERAPVFVWIHGGGWTLGAIEENEMASRAVCAHAGVAVLALEYRLAPEHPYPAAIEDCLAAVAWIAEHGDTLGVDPARLAVGGESAGGYLTTVVALHAREHAGPAIAAQVLVCPVTDLPDRSRESYRAYGDGFGMSAASMDFFFAQFDPTGRLATVEHGLPLREPDLSSLPPALVLTAECDVLRDEGEQLAGRLHDAGVDVTRTRYAGQVHGFYGLYVDLPAAPRAYREVAAFLRARLDAL
ncbi:MAG TPA: alpha/beta hydrolase [Cellulomonas sp.]